MTRKGLSPDQIRTLFESAMLTRGTVAIAKQAGVAQSTVRLAAEQMTLGFVPSDTILLAIGIEVETIYRLKPVAVQAVLPELGKA